MSNQAIQDFPINEESYMVVGDTYDGFTITMDDDGTPVDLTNVAIYLTCKVKGKKFLNLSEGNGITKTDPLNGVFRVDPLVVPNYPGKMPYEIEIQLPGDVKKTYMAGHFRVKPAIN